MQDFYLLFSRRGGRLMYVLQIPTSQFKGRKKCLENVENSKATKEITSIKWSEKNNCCPFYLRGRRLLKLQQSASRFLMCITHLHFLSHRPFVEVSKIPV
uniref:Uncharacterized protein n=1 Tax=Micrurus lemniscatus lemniscatus TaxID=129467 RepID=A0A2D4HM02_MICLE